MVSKQKILIVDDDNNIAELIALYLTKECFETKIVNDGEEALKKFASFHPDLIILDLMLPGIDGYQVCREIRHTSDVPIIMLSAKGETFDKVLGLELGADDYMIKPFDSKELVARVKAVLRRCAAPRRDEDDEETIRIGRLEVKQMEHKVSVGGSEVVLTLKEYELLRKFLQHPGIVFSRDKLLNDIWGYEFSGETRTVDVHIRTLRQKLGEAGELIETIRGVGYRMAAVK